MAKFPPTPQQQAAIDAVAAGSGNVAVVARAGTGKTKGFIVPAVIAYAALHPDHEVAVVAYNKAIQLEIDGLLKPLGLRNVRAVTCHSLGLSAMPSKKNGGPEIDEKKVYKIIDAQEQASNNPRPWREYGTQVAQLVGYAKQTGFGFFDDCHVGDTHAWYELADHYDVNGFEETTDMDWVIRAAQHVYKLSLDDTKTVDFNDMILFPLVKNIRIKYPKDLIVGDEWQDVSRARMALVRKFMRPGTGRMAVVGDDRQAIYGFSGADDAALPRAIEELGATVFPLTVTWRCPLAVVRLAQTLVPDIEAAPGAAEGEIRHVATLDPKSLTPADAILCRNNAPLITAAYALIRAGVACRVEGREIGTGLKKLAGRWKVATIDALLKRLVVYEEREVQKNMAKDNDRKVAEVQDRCATLREICGACTAQRKTQVADVFAFIDGLFADGEKNVVTLASYHKSKGREWRRVHLLRHAELCPSKMARQDWQKRQEENLAYVAYTRAMESLIFVQDVTVPQPKVGE